MDKEIRLQLKKFILDGFHVTLFVPDETSVQAAYLKSKAAGESVQFPYWAKIWPSALAMGRLLINRPDYYSGKTVLEIAAGLGLPSLVVSGLAKNVICSDYLQEAVDTIAQSARHNQFNNVTAVLLDWNSLPGNLNCDLLLLSDINYEPAEFKKLQRLVLHFLENGTTIILSTPQRLMAKPFIETIAEFIIEQEEFTEQSAGEPVIISVITLKKTSG